MSLSADISALIGFACETALWGAYAILFCTSLVLLLSRANKGFSSVNIPITVASWILFATCTTHFALEFSHFYSSLSSTGVEGFGNETRTLAGADLLISICDLFGNSIILYRCWALWNKDYRVVVLPTMCALGGLACTSAGIHFILAISSTSPTPPPSTVSLALASFALPLCANVMATGLIVFKVWRAAYSPGPGLSLPSTMRMAHGAITIIVESGILYLITQIILVVLVSIDHPAQAIVWMAAVQIYGIAPALIVIRVGLGIAVETTCDEVSRPIAWASSTVLDSEQLRTGSSTYRPDKSGSQLLEDK